MKKRLLIVQTTAVVLLLLSLGLLVFRQAQIRAFRNENEALAAQIASILPERTWGSPRDGADQEMPALQLQGTDYVCLLEVPALGLRFPVANQWQTEELKRHPCRYWGSIYDGSMILGGSARERQFDFCGRLDLGDEIIVTDMQGTAFRCHVERIDRIKTAEFDRLCDERAALTLFVQDAYDAGYIIVRCGWLR